MELKPCPFCGGEARYVVASGVECLDCDTVLPCIKDRAEALWNRRVIRSAEAAREQAVEDYDKVGDAMQDEPNAYKRACFRAGWSAAHRAIVGDE